MINGLEDKQIKIFKETKPGQVNRNSTNKHDKNVAVLLKVKIIIIMCPDIEILKLVQSVILNRICLRPRPMMVLLENPFAKSTSSN